MFKIFKILITTMMLVGFLKEVKSQGVLKEQGDMIKEKSIFFMKEENNKISYFTKRIGIDDREEIDSKKTFALKSNYSNVYFKWLNPFKYKIVWKDSVFIDERDKAIIDLITSVAGTFGVPTANTAKLQANQQLMALKPNLKRLGGKTFISKTGQVRDTIIVPETGLNSSNLIDLYLQLRLKDNQGLLYAEEVQSINNITPTLKELDEVTKSGIAVHVDESVSTLIEVTDPVVAKQSLEDEEGNIKTYKGAFKTIEGLQKNLTTFLQVLVVNDALLNSLIKTRIQNFLDETQKSLNEDKRLISNFDKVLNQLKISLKDEAEMRGFFRVRNLKFDDGTTLETAITVSEYELLGDPKVITKKGDVSTSKLTFKKYDFFEISVSAGIFYASTTLKNYGITPGAGDFIVTEDVVNKSTAVTAVFGNINFGTGSRYFSPLIQLGIDPTKKIPFLLLGSGFSIPVAKFSISAGGIWTWDQSLNKLEPGEHIKSSTDLEKDVKNSFNVKPKGWYLGLQFNL